MPTVLAAVIIVGAVVGGVVGYIAAPFVYRQTMHLNWFILAQTY